MIRKYKIKIFEFHSKEIYEYTDKDSETTRMIVFLNTQARGLRMGGAYMRVDSFAQIQSMYNLGNKNKQVKTESSRSFSDQLQISSIGKDIQTAKQAVAGAADVREELVGDIKSKIDAGTYSVDSDSLAEKLFAQFSRTL